MIKDFISCPSLIIIGITVLFLAGSCSQESSIVREKKEHLPDIICITVEDTGPLFACYGDSTVPTPAIDELAGDGILFKNMFAVAGIAGPNQACLYTGLYPTSFGAGNSPLNIKGLPDHIPPYQAIPPVRVKCFTEYLREQGYYCTTNMKTEAFNLPLTAFDTIGNASWESRPTGMPVFSLINIPTTQESQIWKRSNDPLAVLPEDVTLPPYYPDHPAVRKDVAKTYTNIAVLDRQVGEIIKKLKNDGLYDKSIIIFLSMNGGPLPRQKREIYDSGLKVPLLVHLPNGKLGGTVNASLTSMVDLAPTILSLSKNNIPDYMQGRVILGNNKSPAARYVYAARDRIDTTRDTRRAIRNRRFEYIHNYEPEKGAFHFNVYRNRLDMMKELLYLKNTNRLNRDQLYWFRASKQSDELYDLTTDPYELNNLAVDPRYADTVKLLHDQLESWMSRIGDKGLISEKKTVWSMWPEGIQPVTAAPTFKLKNKKISISSATPGASIAFIINKHEPSPNKRWLLYTGTLKLSPGDTLSAIAVRIGYKNSKEVAIIQE